MGGSSHILEQRLNELVDFLEGCGAALVTGASGVGKTRIARKGWERLSDAYPHLTGEFVSVTSGALKGDTMLSKLLGHEAGAFTGAHRQRKGALERAHRGVLFLDEIADLDLEAQNVLVTAIEGELERVGGSETIQVELLVIAATNQDLWKLVEAGEFREDLYYRLAPTVVDIPSLEGRPDDVVAIANDWIRRRVERGFYPDGTKLSPSGEVALSRLPLKAGEARAVQAAVGKALARARQEVGGDRDVPLVLEARHFGVELELGEMESRALHFLRSAGRPVQVSEVATAIGRSPNRAGNYLRKLENAGLALNENRKWRCRHSAVEEHLRTLKDAEGR